MLDLGRWNDPPRWLWTIARRGSGPVGFMTLAFEAYGLGIAILGAVAGLVRYDPNLVGFVLASWLLGGIVLLGITDGLLSWWSRRT